MSTPTVIELKARDLTPDGEIFCPNPKADMTLWNAHPRVFLKLSVTGQAKCPYCGTEYRLDPAEAGHSARH